MTELEEKVKEILLMQGKIPAVKYYHEETGYDLVKSKEYVDHLALKYGVKNEISTDYGCFITALLFILGVSIGVTMYFVYDSYLWCFIILFGTMVVCAVRSGNEEKKRVQKEKRKKREMEGGV